MTTFLIKFKTAERTFQLIAESIRGQTQFKRKN